MNDKGIKVGKVGVAQECKEGSEEGVHLQVTLTL